MQDRQNRLAESGCADSQRVTRHGDGAVRVKHQWVVSGSPCQCMSPAVRQQAVVESPEFGFVPLMIRRFDFTAVAQSLTHSLYRSIAEQQHLFITVSCRSDWGTQSKWPGISSKWWLLFYVFYKVSIVSCFEHISRFRKDSINFAFSNDRQFHDL